MGARRYFRKGVGVANPKRPPPHKEKQLPRPDKKNIGSPHEKNTYKEKRPLTLIFFHGGGEGWASTLNCHSLPAPTKHVYNHVVKKY